jgi:hypothetical protein
MSLKFSTFQAVAKSKGLLATDCGNGHWRLEGPDFKANWYPRSRRQSLYINGMTKGFDGVATVERALELALNPTLVAAPPKAERKKSYKKVKQRLLAQNPFCIWCKNPLTAETATIDHVIPLSRGGTNGTDNMRLACNGCNQSRKNKLPGEQ